MVTFTFSAKSRLLTSRDFSYVFQNPQKVESSTVTILGRLNNLGYPRIGTSIAKKSIKDAHERNRIKRLIRERFRLCQHELKSMDFVILVKKEVASFSNKEVSKILGRLWIHYYRFSLNV